MKREKVFCAWACVLSKGLSENITISALVLVKDNGQDQVKRWPNGSNTTINLIFKKSNFL